MHIHLTNNFYRLQEFEGNRLTEESLPSFPGITGIYMEFKRNRLTGDSLPSFPGIPENFLEFEGNRLTGKSLPGFPGIPRVTYEDEYYLEVVLPLQYSSPLYILHVHRTTILHILKRKSS